MEMTQKMTLTIREKIRTRNNKANLKRLTPLNKKKMKPKKKKKMKTRINKAHVIKSYILEIN